MLSKKDTDEIAQALKNCSQTLEKITQRIKNEEETNANRH
jgi:uncharacterized protein YukE